MKLWLSYLCVFLIIPCYGQGDSWQEILDRGTGEVTFYWYPNNIKVSESKDIIDGVERDLAMAFISYLNASYNVKIEANWSETDGFGAVLSKVEGGSGGIFGASSISITEDRATRMRFTPAYLADIAVMISHSEMPVALSEQEFINAFRNTTAITIPNTTISAALDRLDRMLSLGIQVEAVKNSGEILEIIDQTPKSFGYVDLPNFLVGLENSNVRRQYFYPIKGEGLAMIYPLKSDWEEPVMDYFNSARFQRDKEEIIIRYLGEDIGDIINQISRSAQFGPMEEIAVSQREKELQYQELLEAAANDQEKTRLTAGLFIVVLGVTFILVFVYYRYRIKTKANALLLNKQQKIEVQNEKLQQLNQEKNDLINIIAHDLRSPLTTILGASQIIGQNDHLSKDEKEMTGFIYESAHKMKAMITKILDVGAIEAGDHNEIIEEFEVAEAIDAVVRIQMESAKKKNINIESQNIEDLRVRADVFYTSQVIENLISNAIKFSDPGTVVQVIGGREDEFVTIKVKDEGPGLTEDDQDRIFQKYQRLSARPTGGEASVGLGLSIAKEYMVRMKGSITFESEHGVGTTFIIKLPAVG